VAAMRAIVVVTTVGTEEQAYLIAREIIARRQAACVNIIPAIRSIYRWKGKICKDGELLLIVKTLQDEFEGVASTIRELHSYELPEILSFGVSQGDQGFLDWIASSVDKDAEFSDDEEEDEIAYAADPDDTDF
jgi:periplasmic divalent cation tolerance protein